MVDSPLVRLTKHLIEHKADFDRLVALGTDARGAALQDMGFDLSQPDLAALNAALSGTEVFIRFDYEEWIRSVHAGGVMPLPGPRWPGQWEKL